jgi:hypothetical protein
MSQKGEMTSENGGGSWGIPVSASQPHSLATSDTETFGMRRPLPEGFFMQNERYVIPTAALPIEFLIAMILCSVFIPQFGLRFSELPLT